MAKTRSITPSKGVDDFTGLERKPGVRVIAHATHYPYSFRGRSPVTRQSRQLAAAKSRYYFGITPTISEAYAGMEKHYREYRRDSLVRGCINLLGFWSTKEGFDVVIEPPIKLGDANAEAAFRKKYEGVKAYIETINARVQFRRALRVAVVRAKIYGKAPFEVEFEGPRNEPSRLIPLPMISLWDVMPDIDTDWHLTSFTYRGQTGFYQPGEMLYFTNNGLESDYEGLSDIEPILDDLDTRTKIRREDLREAATTLWAGMAVHSLDVDRLPSGLTEADIQKIIDEHIQSLKPGKHIATDNRWNIQVVDLKPDLDKLVRIKQEIDRDIIANFLVPRFLLNREEQINRATAYTALEAFVEGPITDIQSWLKDDIETQWYAPLARAYLGIPQDQELPFRVVHQWRELRTTDFFDLMDTISRGFAQGTGWLDQEKAYELMRDGPSTKFDPTKVAGKPTGGPKFEIPLDIVARPKQPQLPERKKTPPGGTPGGVPVTSEMQLVE